MPDDIFRIRRDNTTNWTTQDPTLALGEIGYDTTLKKLKVGTGSAAWTVLDFVTAGITNGTYGDIVVSGGGSTWNLSSALMTTINSKLNSGPLNGGTPAAAIQVMQLRRGTAWTGVVLNAGEMGYDTAANEIRVGNGSTAWDGLDPIGLPKISSFILDDLGDVTISGPANGDILTWNGSEWTNLGPAGPGPLSLNDLTNVSLSGPTNTQVLQFNGTNWVNTNLVLVPTGPAGGDLGGTFPNPVINTAAVTLGKLETRNRSTLLGVGTGVGTKAAVQEITLGSGLSFSGSQIVLNSLSISDISGLQTALDNKVDDSQISAFGLTLIDDVDAATARTTLGLGTIATQDANNIAVTGGTLHDVTVTTGTYSSPVNQGLLMAVRKSTAGTITKGRPVYIVGSTGTRIRVELAQADTEATSAYTIGVAATDITNTADGFIMLKGRLTGLNNLPTSTFADGDPIYLSESTAGGFRTTLPTAPNHGVFIGFVVKASNGNAGEMDVHLQNYQELEELSDVNISGIAADHFLKRNATNTRWENVSPANARTGLGLGTLATQNGTFSGTSSGTNTGDQTITLTGDVTGSGTGSFAATISNDAVTYAKMQNVSDTDRLLGRSSAGAGDIQEIVCTAYARNILDDVDAAAARTTLGLGTTDTPQFAGINLLSGEFISNSSNGRIDLGPNGIDPASPAEDFMALTIDGTWGFGVFLGTRNTRTDALNTGNILFQVPLILNNDTRFAFGSSQNYFIRHVSGSSRAGLACGLLVNNAGSTGSFVIAEGNEVTAANRIPAIAHTDPTLYLYARGSANANDFVRANHDTTDGLVESGRGKLRLKGASAVRIEGSSGGFDLPATAGSNGQVLTTDGTNASWQTPTGGGGGVDEDFVIAMAIALG